jgi:rhomboid protease GluP
MCPNCRAFVTTSDRVCPYCNVQLGPPPRARLNTGKILGGMIPQARFTTILILVINTGLYLADTLNPRAGLTQAGASGPWGLDSIQLWRLVTAGFLHGNILHILMNSWVLFDLGAEVEQIYGTSRLIVFYFVSTITGFFLSSHMGLSSLGSSAGIFGLIGAMLAFGVTDQSSLGAAVKSLYTRWLIYALAMSFIPGVDFYAHIGGLAGGFGAGYLASTPRARLLWKEPLIRGMAIVSIVLTAAAFAMMIRFMMALSASPASL